MAPKLTNRQKIAHLLRRFGLGATEQELNHLEPMGVDGALEYLFDYEKTDEGFGVNPWEICREADKPDLYYDGYRFANWWALRLVMSQRPVEQKLTLFWHNHFPVGGDKVEFGPMLLTYLETLRVNAMGDFPTLLKAISRDPAMLRYLDGDLSIKSHPNENFARELMELFTIGKGHYSEQDVQEAARAFTGWGNRYLMYEDLSENLQTKLKDCVDRDVPMVTASFSPSLFDDSPKTVLGKRADYTLDSLLEMLAATPQTSYRVTSKMWRFFAMDDLPDAVANRLARVFVSTNGNTKAVLKEIAKTDEFWSEKCLRAMPKSPLDFIIPILRQFNLHSTLVSLHGIGATRDTPLSAPLRGCAGLAFGTMLTQGMTLLYPPNVGGWNGGLAWISPNNIMQRIQFADLVCEVDKPDRSLPQFLAKQILDFYPGGSYNAIYKLLQIFDAEVPPVKQYLLQVAFDKAGGLDSLKTPQGASKTLAAVCRLLFACPEFQFC